MTPISQYIDIAQLLAPSLFTAAAVAVAASTVGVFVMLRREALVALAMPHVVAVGAAIGLRMGWPTLPPALVAVALALVMLIGSRRHGSGNWVLPCLYIAGLSISFLIIANSGAHVAELQAVFTGIDVAVSESEAAFAIPPLLLVGVVCAMLWRRWLLLSQSPATAEAAGLHSSRWDAGFLCILAIVLLIGTASLGAVMVIAMLFLPSAAVLPWSRRIPAALVMSSMLSLLLLLMGFVFSVEFNFPLSQSVGGVGFAVLVLAHALAILVR